MASVSIRKCASYNDVDTAIRRAVNDLGGIRKFVKKGDKVLLKPNMLMAAAPEKAITTHPAVVESVIRLVQEAGGKVFVGDSPAAGTTLKVAKATGIETVCRKTGAKLVPFREYYEVPFIKGEITKRFMLAKIVKNADVIINLPKYKTHSLTMFTGAVKNHFGCIPGLTKGEFHIRLPENMDFSNMLVDLCLCVNSRLSIVDGVVAMEGNGPAGGTPKKTGIVAASADPFALDAVLVHYAGLRFEDVPVLVNAKRRKLTDFDNIKITGDKPAKKFDFEYQVGHSIAQKIPKWLYRFVRGMVLPKPVISSECIACGKCARNCPAKTIIIKKKAVINYKNCIRCFCCQEICPEHAIDIKHSLPGKMLLFVKTQVERFLL